MEVALIPAYEPDEQLVILAGRLAAKQLPMLIVDDGSSKENQRFFEQVESEYPEYVKVYHCEKNGGKGRALKTGMAELRRIYPECTAFITADADGQHKIDDILAVREALRQGAKMVLTMRNFDGKIPLTSRMGNNLSRWVYTIMTGHYYKDNQSGLRGFSVDQLDWLTKVPGEKYDYELSMLYYAHKKRVKVEGLTIETIYLNGNKSSHFDPLRDTLRIYRCLFTCGRASLISSLLYFVAMIVCSNIWNYENAYFTVAGGGILATILCIVMECVIFKRVGYRDADDVLISRIVRSAVYTAGILAAARFLPAVPMWVAFLILVILVACVRYFFNKLLAHVRG